MLNRLKFIPDPLMQQFVSGYLDYEKDTNSPFMISFMPPFVASFCENRDQLELWRQYGDDGRGFSLGFRVRDLQEVVARQGLGGIYVYKILYDRNEQCNCTNKILNFFLNEFRKIHGTEGNSLSINYASLRTALNFFIPFFKHPCYANEQENRLVLHGSHTSYHETKFLARRGYFKPYIDLEIGTDEAFPLDTVVIGPATSSPLDTVLVGPATSSPRCEKSLRMFLDYHGLKSTKIEYSHLPYLGNDKGPS